MTVSVLPYLGFVSFEGTDGNAAGLVLSSLQQLCGIFLEIFSAPCWHSDSGSRTRRLLKNAKLNTSVFWLYIQHVVVVLSVRVSQTACASALRRLCRKDNQRGSADVEDTKEAVGETQFTCFLLPRPLWPPHACASPFLIFFSIRDA